MVALVFASDEPCRGAQPHDDDWLWGDAVLRDEHALRAAPPSRFKDFTIAVGVRIRSVFVPKNF